MPVLETMEIMGETFYKRKCDFEKCDHIFITHNPKKIYHNTYCGQKAYILRRKRQMEVALARYRLDNALPKDNGLTGICVICGKPSETRVHSGECEELDTLINKQSI